MYVTSKSRGASKRDRGGGVARLHHPPAPKGKKKGEKIRFFSHSALELKSASAVG